MSVRKRGNKWVVDIEFKHPNGSRQRIRQTSPVQTKRGAERYEREVRQQLLDGTFGIAEKEETPVTLAEFAPFFLKTYAETNNKPSEVRNKEYIIRVHLIPAFGKRALQAIGVRDIEDFKARLLAKKMAPKSINNFLACLRRMLVVAQEWDMLDSVPAIRWLKVPEPSFRFLNFTESERLIRHTESRWRPMVVLALKTGLRQGELLALRWSDVNLDKQSLIVQRSYFCGNVTTPKSGKSREVPLCLDALQVLLDCKPGQGRLIFSDENGDYLTAAQCRKPLYRACRRAGIEKIGWHVLRHTFASHLTIKGAPLKVVQELLGHSTITMTMRYAHLSPEAKHDAVQLLQSCGTIAAQKEKGFRNYAKSLN